MFKYLNIAQDSFTVLICIFFSFISSVEQVHAQSAPLVPNPYTSYGEEKKTEDKNYPRVNSSSEFNIQIGSSLGYEKVSTQGGLGINGNLNANFSNFTASLEVVDFFIYGKQGNSGYYTDNFSNGQSRCRSSSSGRFAKSSSCSPDIGVDVKFLNSVDLSYKLPIDSTGNKLFAGVGTPINNSISGIYGVFGYESSSGFLAKAKLGNDTIDIRIGF